MWPIKGFGEPRDDDRELGRETRPSVIADISRLERILIPIASLRQGSARSPVLAQITGEKTPLGQARCSKAAQKPNDLKGLRRKIPGSRKSRTGEKKAGTAGRKAITGEQQGE
jgi:hypothetical protein